MVLQSLFCFLFRNGAMTAAGAVHGHRKKKNQSGQSHATETAKGHDVLFLLESPF